MSNEQPTAGDRISARSPEQFLEDRFNLARETVQHSLDDLEAYVQLRPQQALLSALGAGYVLRMLPTTRLLGGTIRLALSLLKPAALIYGLSKIWYATQTANKTATTADSGTQFQN